MVDGTSYAETRLRNRDFQNAKKALNVDLPDSFSVEFCVAVHKPSLEAKPFGGFGSREGRTSLSATPTTL